MLYHLLYPLAQEFTIFNVLRYVTFRSIASFITALLFSLLIGPSIIRLLKEHKAREVIDNYMPEGHHKKVGTPTMGGLIIISGLLLASLLWNDLTNSYVLMLILTVVSMGTLGFIDDYLKNFKKKKDGLVAKYKYTGQIILGLIIGFTLFFHYDNPGDIAYVNMIFFKNVTLYLGIFLIPFIVFMIVATTNAVNLTDGLDGLASGIIALTAFGLAVMAYIKGNFIIADYLKLEFIPEAGELVVFTAAVIGTSIGFLWYNAHPAQIFMGDTGSLSMGGVLALLSILLREEIFFAIIGFVFVAEAASSIMQKYYFKITRKITGTPKRLFKCAPLHHHFEKLGIKETKIVVRFWIVATILVALGLSTLKLR